MTEHRGAVMLAALGLGLGALFTLAGCGASADEVACERYEEAACELAARCPHTSLIPFPYASLSSCKARQPLICKVMTSLPGSAYRSDNLDACAKTLANSACAASPAPACTALLRGQLDAGAACSSSIQCRSGWCDGSATTCGVCRVAASEGQHCGGLTACGGGGVVCDFVERVCRAPAGKGEACDPNVGCVYPLACLDGRCGSLALGAGCEIMGATDPCDRVEDLHCAGGVCVKSADVIHAEGGSCDDAFCVAGTFCDQGVCRADLADGAACTDATATACAPPAVCAGGICTIVPEVCP